jgi:hypothetical protein
MDQCQRTGSPCSSQCAKQDRAVAADDQRELASSQRAGNNFGKFEIEAAYRVSIAQPGAGCGSVL